MSDEELVFDIGQMSRNELSRMLVICGKVGNENAQLYRNKAKELDCDFILEKGRSWVLTHKNIQDNYDSNFHKGVLLIGSNKELPATQITYQGAYAFTDWFIQDLDDDNIPDFPIGRVYGPSATVLYHMDPRIVDSNIAIVFDSQPGRSNRHVDGLVKLGFDVQVLRRYRDYDKRLMSVSEFILQFSDGIFANRIHGAPDKWATHNSVILSSDQMLSLKFEGYPVVYSEACSTAQDGPLLRTFLDQGAIYIGSTLDTMNNLEPFNNWRNCPYCDGWKFGFLDLLDTYPFIGEVKVAVDRAITENLEPKIRDEIESIRNGGTNTLTSNEAVSVCEWVMFGNPLRPTTVGPNADYTPGKLIVDT